MEQRFTQEQHLLHKLVLHCNDTPVQGLMDGKMGILLVLSEYTRFRKLKPLKTAIGFLLEQITNNLSKEMSLEFDNGLTGIGWGIEYLLKNKFQRGFGADICAEIDQKLMSQNILRQTCLNLDKGIEGWLHYIIAHQQGAQSQKRNVFDATYLQDCSDMCKRLVQQDIPHSLRQLCLMFIAMSQGKSIKYIMNLASFINPTTKRNTQLLGLRNGIAGLLFTTIINKQNS